MARQLTRHIGIATLARSAAPATRPIHYTYRQVLARRGLWQLAVGQGLSLIGDWFNNVALLILIYQVTHSPQAVGLLLVAKLLPRVLITPFAGAVVSRADCRQLMIATDLARAVVAFIPFFVGSSEMAWLLFSSIIVLQALSMLFEPARRSLVPELVEKPALPVANSLLQVVGELAFFSGPALGAIVTLRFGLASAFSINSATFIISAILLWSIGPIRARVSIQPSQRSQLLRQIRAGLAIVRASDRLTLFFLVFALDTALAMVAQVTILPFIQHQLHLRDYTLGYCYTAIGLGTMTAAYLFARIGQRISPAPALLVGLAVLGAAIIGLGTATSLGAVLTWLVLAGIMTTTIDLLITTFIQQEVAETHRGVVFGLILWAVALGQMLGALSATFMEGLFSENVGGAVELSIATVLLIGLGAGIIIFRRAYAPARAQ